MMTKDCKDLLRALNANAAKYLIVGGHDFLLWLHCVQQKKAFKVSASLHSPMPLHEGVPR